MGAEDYQTERNGIEMNISKAIRLDKVEKGWMNFKKLQDRFDIEYIENVNNVIRFKLYDSEYYFGLVKSKIRKKNEREWTGKLITKLKSDIQELHNRNDY